MNCVLSLAKLGSFTDVNAGEALFYSLLGMLVIFSVLAFLICAVLIYKAVFALMSGDKKKKEEKTAPVAKPVAQPQTATVVNSEEEIAAVIGAVMAIYYTDAATGKTAPFKVKSILRLK